MDELRCSQCKRPVAEFRGRSRQCQQCYAAYRENRRQKNVRGARRKEREYMRRWRKRNPGYSGRKTKQIYNPVAQKRYRAKYLSKPSNRERENAYGRAYYAQHREEILAQKKRKKLERVCNSITQASHRSMKGNKP